MWTPLGAVQAPPAVARGLGRDRLPKYIGQWLAQSSQEVSAVLTHPPMSLTRQHMTRPQQMLGDGHRVHAGQVSIAGTCLAQRRQGARCCSRARGRTIGHAQDAFEHVGHLA
jgi:hypothetical protein